MAITEETKTIFTKEDFKSKIKHLEFSDDFEIDLNKNQIIFASNGIGKTSIYDFLKEINTECSYIDYAGLKEDLIKSGKKITIGSKISVLDSKKEEKLNLITELSIKDRIKNLGVNKQADASESFKILKDFFKKKEEINASESFISNFDNTDKDFLAINNLPKEEKDFFIGNMGLFFSIDEKEYKIENIRNRFLVQSMDFLEKYLEDETVCPICSTEKNTKIKDIIKKNKSDILVIKSQLIDKALSIFPNKKLNEIELLIKTITSSIKEKNKEILINFGITGGNSEFIEKLLKTKIKVSVINGQIEDLEVKAEKFYKRLKKRENEIRRDFKNYFEVTNDKDIVFNNDEKFISITLKRDAKTYSTGESNLMAMIVSLNEAVASDKNYIVIDDPLSSYDLVNQYKIMYEIIALNKEYVEKKITLLTHNANTHEIASSQDNGFFKNHWYIDKFKKHLHIQEIKEINEGRIFEISNFIKDDTTDDKKYIDLLLKKKDWGEKDEDHNLFHYHLSFSKKIDGFEFSNDYLFNLVENLDIKSFNFQDFKSNGVKKIVYLSALRVWVEKQFYDKGYTENEEFGKKIDKVFPKNEDQLFTWNNKLDRSFLMSKKVMLNQNCHSESQENEFNYALNLTIDDILNEILEIKKAFIVVTKNEIEN